MLFRGAHDGLERELRFFNRLEGGLCTVCALEDQENFSMADLMSLDRSLVLPDQPPSTRCGTHRRREYSREVTLVGEAAFDRNFRE